MKYNILPDAKEVNKLYHISAWPTHLIIDKADTVSYMQVGGSNVGEALARAIKAVM